MEKIQKIASIIDKEGWEHFGRIEIITWSQLNFYLKWLIAKKFDEKLSYGTKKQVECLTTLSNLYADRENEFLIVFEKDYFYKKKCLKLQADAKVFDIKMKTIKIETI